MNSDTRSRSGRTKAVTMLVLGLALGLTGTTYAGETSSDFSGTT